MGVTGLDKVNLAMQVQTSLLRKQLDNQAANILKLVDSATIKDAPETTSLKGYGDGARGARLDIFG